jgi:hypothetical protein
MSESEGETFEDFKKSFKYGSRNDLHFKFLAGMSDEDAAEFLRVLLETLGDAFDAGGPGGARVGAQAGRNRNRTGNHRRTQSQLAGVGRALRTKSVEWLVPCAICPSVTKL